MSTDPSDLTQFVLTMQREVLDNATWAIFTAGETGQVRHIRGAAQYPGEGVQPFALQQNKKKRDG